jgi:molybdate transport system substrate-binding protein
MAAPRRFGRGGTASRAAWAGEELATASRRVKSDGPPGGVDHAPTPIQRVHAIKALALRYMPWNIREFNDIRGNGEKAARLWDTRGHAGATDRIEQRRTHSNRIGFEQRKGWREMLRSYAKRPALEVLGAATASLLLLFSIASAQSPTRPTNINLAVASNFYGTPPSNSAITDIIVAFEAANPTYRVTVTDNGATSTLADHIIDGNKHRVDLFLAADTATPYDLLTNHFDLVTTYNSPVPPPLYVFNYAQGTLALLSNIRGVDLSCATGTCGYDPRVYRKVAIADPKLAPYGAAAQTVLVGVYGLTPPLSSNSLVHEYPNITDTYKAVIAQKEPVGFVALSAICSEGAYPTSGTSALAYFPLGPALNPSLLINNYNPLTQAGIAIKRSRTAAQDTELTAFVAFLTDFTVAPLPDSPMITTLKKYCYSAP